MNLIPNKICAGLFSALAGLTLSATVGVAKPLITVNTYDSSSSINGDWSWYGGAVIAWDGTQDHTGNSGGSLHITHDANAGDHIYCPEAFSGNQWNSGTTYDLTLYTNMTVWIKWDTNYSTMPISAFNSNGGLGINLNDNANGEYGSWNGANAHGLPSQQIPNTASNGWVLLNFPINAASIPNIDQIGAFIFNVYHSVPWSGNVGFWVDDITFQPAAVDVIPPPTVQPPIPAIPGLNVFASTEGSLYDRQSARLRQQSGLSWVGVATPANPVTYSFTINGFPDTLPTFGCEAYLFLIPNPVYNDNAPDWNETNVVQAYVQQGATSATMYFQYKVNNAYNNAMYGGGNNGGIYYTNPPTVGMASLPIIMKAALWPASPPRAPRWALGLLPSPPTPTARSSRPMAPPPISCSPPTTSVILPRRKAPVSMCIWACKPTIRPPSISRSITPIFPSPTRRGPTVKILQPKPRSTPPILGTLPWLPGQTAS